MILTRAELRAALNNPNLRALLMVIRTGLGTAEAHGYRTLIGGGEFDDLRWHPSRRVTLEVAGRPVVSTQAGAYRILHKTWDGLSERYGYEDFGATCQDEAAVALVALAGALPDILDGHFSKAVDACATEWSCLPGSPYGAPEDPQATALTLDSALEIYHHAGGRLSPARAEIEPPPAAETSDGAPARLPGLSEGPNATPAPPPRRAGIGARLLVGLAVVTVLMAWALRARGAIPWM